MLSAFSNLGWFNQVLTISEARLADLPQCWSAWELWVMNSLFCLKLLYAFSFPTCQAACQGSRDCRGSIYVCMHTEEEQQLKTGGSGWSCNSWYCCLGATNRNEANGMCSSRCLGWITKSLCWEHGTISWLRDRVGCTGRLLSVCILHYQGSIWCQNLRSWLSLLFCLCFQGLSNYKLLKQVCVVTWSCGNALGQTIHFDPL